MSTLYRVFVQDVGDRGFSGFDRVTAASRSAAVKKASRGRASFAKKLVAIPESRPHLWPDDKTGFLPTVSS